MTTIWLVAWALAGAPAVHDWNGWMVALVVVLVIDILGRNGSRA